jgi:hypothetical protein
VSDSRDLLAAATPRPWVLFYDPAEGHGVEAIFDSAVVAACDKVTNAKNDAALIVAAVNEYAPLLEVEASLRAVADFLQGQFKAHALDALANLDAIRGA